MSVLWLASRATGEIAVVLLTITTVLGILQGASTRPITQGGSPGNRLRRRFLTSELHRRISLLALAFLGAHVATVVVDTYVDVPWWAAFVPFSSPYETGAIALGALAVDILIVVALTSLLRARIAPGRWKSIHLTAYAAWVVGAVHGLLAGTDQALTLGIALTGGVTVALALLARMLLGLRKDTRRPAPTRSVSATAPAPLVGVHGGLGPMPPNERPLKGPAESGRTR